MKINKQERKKMLVLALAIFLLVLPMAFSYYEDYQQLREAEKTLENKEYQLVLEMLENIHMNRSYHRHPNGSLMIKMKKIKNQAMGMLFDREIEPYLTEGENANKKEVLEWIKHAELLEEKGYDIYEYKSRLESVLYDIESLEFLKENEVVE